MATSSRSEPGPIFRLLADDHRRLEGLLDRATADPSQIDLTPYGEFRRGLLRHIGMEEKILLPAAQRAQGGRAVEIAARLRLDHGAIVSLMVPTPTAAIVGALRKILSSHNELEEGAGGLYDECDRLLGDDASELLARLRSAPDVPVHPHVDSENVMDATRRALRRAGYDLP